jgi:hypothetical protein
MLNKLGLPGQSAVHAMARDRAMGTLIADDIDDDLIARLEARAAAQRRSAEAEHREILRQALTGASPDLPLGDMRGKTWMAPDFDETPEDIIDAMEGDAI